MARPRSVALTIAVGVALAGGLATAAVGYFPTGPGNIALRLGGGSLVQAYQAARPVVHSHAMGPTTPVTPYPRAIPPPTWPKPTPPYSASLPHPIPVSSIAPAALLLAVKFSPHAPGWHPGQFLLDDAWQISPTVQIATGHRTGDGWPFLPVLSKQTPKLYWLLIDGGPGPATMEGVQQPWVLLRQGAGYEVFNLNTFRVLPSDQNGTPGSPTKLY